MIGIKSRFVTLVKNKWPHVTWRCSLHRYTLASKILTLHLLEFINVAVKMISFSRSNAKNLMLFQLLTEEIKAQHVGLLFYTKVPWRMPLSVVCI